ncbi:MAG: hypothetical protein ACTSVZ_12625 [Promethearchaeota archaeon]
MQSNSDLYATIIITNPSNWERTGLVNVKFHPVNAVSSPQIYNEVHAEITSQILLQEETKVYNISFVVEDIPPNGEKRFFIKKRDTKADFQPPEEGLLDGNDYYLENDSLRIVVETDGSFTIMFKEIIPETPEEEKLLIMGEELGKGSIWAADQFFNIRNLNLLQIDGNQNLGQNLQAKLLMASDCGGRIEITQDYLTHPVTTFLTLAKGESPLVQFENKLPQGISQTPVKFLFRTGLVCPEPIKDNNSLTLWDTQKKHGLAIIATQLNTEVIQSGDAGTLVLLNAVPEYALVPLHPSEEDPTLPDLNSVSKFTEEYLHPLTSEIRFQN